MRCICIFLCASLFTSLVHASAMPMPNNLVGKPLIERMVQHDCHAHSDSSGDKSQSGNYQTHHQCCLGVIANVFSGQSKQLDFSSHFALRAPQLVIEELPAHIFKPPKQIS